MAGRVETPRVAGGSRVAVVNGEAALINNHMARRGEGLCRPEIPTGETRWRRIHCLPAGAPRGSSADRSAVRRTTAPVFIDNRTEVPAQDNFINVFTILRRAFGGEPQGEHQSGHIFC